MAINPYNRKPLKILSALAAVILALYGLLFSVTTWGDAIVMTSGLYGTIVTLDDTVATLEVAPGVQVQVDRRAIGSRSTEVA